MSLLILRLFIVVSDKLDNFFANRPTITILALNSLKNIHAVEFFVVICIFVEQQLYNFKITSELANNSGQIRLKIIGQRIKISGYFGTHLVIVTSYCFFKGSTPFLIFCIGVSTLVNKLLNHINVIAVILDSEVKCRSSIEMLRMIRWLQYLYTFVNQLNDAFGIIILSIYITTQSLVYRIVVSIRKINMLQQEIKNVLWQI